ncbi:MAG TPA: hypothetical protein VGS28_01935 [Candidatus Saccharimonadales bacterium]|nr:hypothetical protein [Candidatus Saccharimonadales bacterium]
MSVEDRILRFQERIKNRLEEIEAMENDNRIALVPVVGLDQSELSNDR